MPREIARKPRFIYPTIATSLSIAQISALAELLLWRILPQADDQGRLIGHPKQLKALACPMREEITEKNIPELLKELEGAELIIQYTASSESLIQIKSWWDYQSGMRRIYPSRHSAPEGWEDRTRGVETIEETGPRTSGHSIRDLLLDALKREEVKLGNATLVEVNKEVRVGNSYIDLLAKDSVGKFYILEIKRTRLTNSHIEQITNYRDIIEAKTKAKPSLLLMGYGMVETLNFELAQTHSINVITYDDQLAFRQVLLGDVKVIGNLTRWRSSDVSGPKPEVNISGNQLIRKPEAVVVPPTTADEKEIIKRFIPLRGWQADEDDVHWLQGLRSEFPGFTLSEFKACVDYYSGRAPPKHKGVWKNRFRNWMIKKREFELKGGKGELPTTKELKEGWKQK